MSSNALALHQSNIIPFPSCEAPEKQGKSNEWYTPAYIIEAARRVLGTIDLDPASCEQANQVVRATRFYSERENGLAQKWYGNVWLNPPYGYTNNKSNLSLFTYKLINAYETGEVNQAILLSTVRTDTDWFFRLMDYLICFSGKIYFEGKIPNPKTYNHKYSHFHGTILVYLGKNEQAFIDTFRELGHIAKSIAGPRHETVQARLWGAV